MLLVSLLTQPVQGFEVDGDQEDSDHYARQSFQTRAHQAIGRQSIKIRYRHPDNLKQSNPFTGEADFSIVEFSPEPTSCQVISDVQRE
jgi:hypothetical protein